MSIFETIGQYSVRYRYLVIVFWAVAVGVITWLAPNLSDLSISDQSAYLSAKEPSIRAQKMIKKHFPKEVFSNSAILVLESKKGSLREAEGAAAISELTSWVKSLKDPKISENLLSPADPNLADRLISRDGRVAIIFAGINGAPDDKAVERTMAVLMKHMASMPAGYNGYVTGDVPITNAYKMCILESAEKTIIITIALVIVCLLLIYRSPILPFVPLVIIGVAYGIARGIVAWLAQHGMVISSMTDLFMVVLLFGAGTDYCLFIISRFKEYMADGMPGSDAAVRTMARVGETITSSAGTLIVADIALSFVSVKLFSSTGPSLAIALLVALCAVMTLTPALLAIIGRRAFWPGKPRHAHEATIWGRLGDWITRVPWAPMTLALLVMVPLAIYGQGQKQTFDILADLPKKNMVRVGYNVLAEKFGVGEMLPVDVLVTGIKDMRKPEGIEKITKTTEYLRSIPGVTGVRSLTSPTGNPDAFTSRVLRVDFQLAQLAIQVDTIGAAVKDPPKLKAFIYSADGMFSTLRDYFDGLAGAFPGLASDPDYAGALAALTRVRERYDSSAHLVKVPAQLAEIDRIMKNMKETDTEAILPKLEMLRLYFRGLTQVAPQVRTMDGYAGAMAALDGLHGRFSTYKQMPPVTRLILMILQYVELENMKSQLSDNLHRLTKEADSKLATTVYVPPVVPPELNYIINPILGDLKKFQGAVRNLSVKFAGRPNGYYAPVELARLPGGGALMMLLDTYTTMEGDAVRYQLLLKDEPFAPAAIETVRKIRGMDLPDRFYVGGNIPVLSDLRDAMKRDTVLMWVLVCGGIMLVLVFLLRSVVAPVYLLGTILLSYNACMGIMRFVFEFLLGREIAWFVPFFMFVLLLALGMDYNIFLMGRVREEAAVHGTRKGVRLAVLHTGGIITSAGIIMAGTFAAMMSSSLLGLVQLSFAITVGVLQDTFITRTILVPSIVVMLDRWNWWPGRLAPKKQVEEVTGEQLIMNNE
jgi:putative drug exporter of the RND superfamily